jgi:hypothetical protein
VSEKLDCKCCGSRDVTEAHIERCRRTTSARIAAEVHAAEQAIPSVTTADLWAHLGHVASPEDATRIVRQVVDLGWRPVVGSDPRRLWQRDAEARS